MAISNIQNIKVGNIFCITFDRKTNWHEFYKVIEVINDDWLKVIMVNEMIIDGETVADPDEVIGLPFVTHFQNNKIKVHDIEAFLV